MTRRKGIMLAYPFSEARLLKWPKPWLVQPKLNGERCRAQISDSGQVTLLSSEENEIVSVPHIKWALENSGLSGVELDGELYNHAWNFQQIHSVVSRKVNIHPNHAEVRYCVFDLKDQQVQEGRLYKLSMLFAGLWGDLPLVRVGETECYTIDEMRDEFERCIDDGYEGVILRHPQALYVDKKTTTMMKLKPREQDEYQIIGYSEEVSQDGVFKNALGAFECIKDDQTFSVGTGPELTREKRIEYWRNRDQLIGKVLVVKYQELTQRGVPWFPVAFDLQDSMSEGG